MYRSLQQNCWLKKESICLAISSYHFRETGADSGLEPESSDIGGGSMAIDFARRGDGKDNSVHFRPIERLKVYMFGATVLFASFGMGEAVYRLLFSQFDGITDRIPLELLFGLVFAWLATKFVGGVYRNRKQRSARLNFIWARNHHIRGAVEGITPLAHPAKNQQSIRVIREEVDRIEWALKEILPS
ncbi:MAG TPA: hypothetical protein VJX47_01115 [Candidatus Sulfotelmatobacter sp.]|nr:hypothetical protein [Candidatus Sulfotelmatobacter sp.]